MAVDERTDPWHDSRWIAAELGHVGELNRAVCAKLGANEDESLPRHGDHHRLAGTKARLSEGADTLQVLGTVTIEERSMDERGLPRLWHQSVIEGRLIVRLTHAAHRPKHSIHPRSSPERGPRRASVTALAAITQTRTQK